jgi:NAD(P)-dependent dehydrogenase (short-subunit alcohol dehydrogenase family)
MTEKIAVITGASSGIGLLTSIELAKVGFQVVATMRDLARRQRLDQAAKNEGVLARLDIRELDVTKLDRLSGFVDQIIHDYGRVDVLVNNAGYPLAGFAEDISRRTSPAIRN